MVEVHSRLRRLDQEQLLLVYTATCTDTLDLSHTSTLRNLTPIGDVSNVLNQNQPKKICISYVRW